VEDKIYKLETTEKLAAHYHEVLTQIGEDPNREGLLKTPERMAKAMQYLTHGYDLNPDEIMQKAIFHEEYSEMVIYIPDGKIVGLSKLPRIVDAYSRRLQVQERLTIEIRDCVQRTLNPKGVAVVIECSHMCMAMRGVQKQNSSTTTSAFTGLFLKNDSTRKEFINLVQAKLH